MADVSVPLLALKTFASQADADLAAAKTVEATAKTALESAVTSRLECEGHVLLAKGTLDVLNGATAVGTAVETAEKSPNTKWYLLGAAVIAVVTIGIVVVKALHWL